MQARLGRERSAAIIESAFGEMAVRLVKRGVQDSWSQAARPPVRRAGAGRPGVGNRSRNRSGVPWTTSIGEPRLALALKSATSPRTSGADARTMSAAGRPGVIAGLRTGLGELRVCMSADAPICLGVDPRALRVRASRWANASRGQRMARHKRGT
jgi:hypothetical protein